MTKQRFIPIICKFIQNLIHKKIVEHQLFGFEIHGKFENMRIAQICNNILL